MRWAWVWRFRVKRYDADLSGAEFVSFDAGKEQDLEKSVKSAGWRYGEFALSQSRSDPRA
jgi:hypothetical protein